jgi:hypothetical protein
MRSNVDGFVVRAACACLMLFGTACSEGTDDPQTGTGGAGGVSGSGGSPGTGGTGGSSGGGSITMLLAFDSASDVPKLALGAPPAGDAGSDPNDLSVGVDGGARALLSFDAAVGDPNPGSLKIEIPTTAYEQYVDYQLLLSPALQDYSGRTLTLKIRLDEGFSPDPSAPGGIIFYAKSGANYDWGQAAWMNIPPASGTWVEVLFDVDNPDPDSSTAGFQPTQLQSIGFKIHTGSGLNATSQPTPAVFHLDSIGYR